MKKSAPRTRSSAFSSVDALADCIIQDVEPDGYPKYAALAEVADLLHLISYKAQKGDNDCGYFLGEMLPVLQKQIPKLERTNDSFRQAFARFGTARLATANSRLRYLIHDIIIRVEAKKRRLQLASEIPDLVVRPNNTLLGLPDLGPSPEVVEQWTNVVV